MLKQTSVNKLDHLHTMRLLVNIVQYESFSKAATQLGISATKASKDIRYLESSLQCTLLHRTTRELHLTDAGKIFYKNALEILELHQQTLDKIKNLKYGMRGELRISAPDLWGKVILTPLILKFKKLYPDVSFRANYSNQNIDINKEGMHIAFRSIKLNNEPYIAKLIHADTLSLCASPNYLKLHKSINHPKALAQHTFISLLASNKVSDQLTFNYHEQKIQQNIRSELAFSNKSDIFSAVKEGFGLAVLPKYLIKEALKAGDLEELLIEYPLNSSNFYALYTQTHRESALINVFVNFVIKETNKNQYY